ncbi:coniferyl-alcohol dehydrogenase [Sphingobium sp. Sx8-8]|uniref:coniferyl-alcohol dehydrogenase n=1 Tax=Sphingobium sp. Sx8-8 TaxID=2933617 RepID=UPI001F59127F|nr:coniferyl-alcohol dehydrogenase [Sphingobium sp. Sx8-8]
MTNIWSYEGKRVAIVGCFSGMGEACARELVKLGAEVHGADIRESPVNLASFTQVDLKDWSSIDKAVAGIGGEIDALFNCAGLPQTFPALDVMRVNFMGIRHWTEQWLPKMKRPGAVASISSLAGMGWLQNVPLLKEAIAIDGEKELIAWFESHQEAVGDGYGFSKQLLNAWTQIQAVKYAKEGIRFNVTMPSPVKTPMYKDFQQVAGDGVLNAFTAPTGRFCDPAEQGNPLVYLNSDAASFISGVALPVDHGFFGGVVTGELNVQELLAQAAAANA